MAPNSSVDLHNFIAAAKEQGASDESLAAILENAGWPKAEIWGALGERYESLRCPHSRRQENNNTGKRCIPLSVVVLDARHLDHFSRFHLLFTDRRLDSRSSDTKQLRREPLLSNLNGTGMPAGYFPSLSVRDARDYLRDKAGAGEIGLQRPQMAHLHRSAHCRGSHDRRRGYLPGVLSSGGSHFSVRCQGRGNVAYFRRSLLVLPGLTTRRAQRSDQCTLIGIALPHSWRLPCS